jgi:hypothetical protein
VPDRAGYFRATAAAMGHLGEERDKKLLSVTIVSAMVTEMALPIESEGS